MRLDHLLSREIIVYYCADETGKHFSPRALGFWGAIGYRNNQAFCWVCLFDSLAFKGFLFFGFFGLVVCFLESGCECLCDALFFVENLVRGHPFFG